MSPRRCGQGGLGTMPATEKALNYNNQLLEGAKMAKQEDSELTSSHKQTKTTTFYRTALIDNDMKTIRTDFLQLRI